MFRLDRYRRQDNMANSIELFDKIMTINTLRKRLNQLTRLKSYK